MADAPKKNPILEATKIQARAVIPIVKALEAELGRERAHAIVGKAIGDSYVAWRERMGFETDAHPRTEAEAGPDFPVEHAVVEDSDTAYGHNITGCAFADYFRAIGEPEIGALMTCGVDFPAEARIRPGWEFRRTQTRMQGAPHCDFRWRRKPPAGG
ncbi:MAG: L-2-amino-thiazoline-4-carboxylic acid hydrolase [Alphaproteobacteria bacterium]|nr:L-2-amino-thiazoline-4-carboxylic acid hydrolase [Alphaproteobacteria bacterium]MCB9928182.1 L-2-amino-thiazoline-4-carboxylic acid hydrolase [Alphaproteobacteria bacterium]